MERFGADLAPIGTKLGCGWLAMAPPSSWSTNNQAHVSASNHSNPIGTTPVPPPTRIRTRGNEYESHESPEDGHARLSDSAQSEVRDMRHATAHHFYEDKSIMSHDKDGSHSNDPTTGVAIGPCLTSDPKSCSGSVKTAVFHTSAAAQLLRCKRKTLQGHSHAGNACTNIMYTCYLPHLHTARA